MAGLSCSPSLRVVVQRTSTQMGLRTRREPQNISSDHTAHTTGGAGVSSGARLQRRHLFLRRVLVTPMVGERTECHRRSGWRKSAGFRSLAGYVAAPSTLQRSSTAACKSPFIVRDSGRKEDVCNGYVCNGHVCNEHVCNEHVCHVRYAPIYAMWATSRIYQNKS